MSNRAKRLISLAVMTLGAVLAFWGLILANPVVALPGSAMFFAGTYSWTRLARL